MPKDASLYKLRKIGGRGCEHKWEPGTRSLAGSLRCCDATEVWEGQLLGHGATPAAAGPSRAHSKTGGQSILPAKPEVVWVGGGGSHDDSTKG